MEQKGERKVKGTGIKILIVDDNNANLYLLEVLLQGAGYDVVTAKNGVEALEKLRAGTFNGIVSDILMPRMDGFRLIRECKKDPVLRRIPFILYTSTYTDKKGEEFGMSLGAIRYISKPAEPEMLLGQINDALREHAKDPKDSLRHPVPDEATFSSEHTQRIGAKLSMKMRALQESEEKYHLLYDNSMDAILLTSMDGSIQAANPAARAMFQRTEEEIIRNGRAGLIDVTDPLLSAALEERVSTNRSLGELTFLRKDGTRFVGEVSSSLFTDRLGQIRSSMIIRDVTERKTQEQALQIANQKLNLMNIVAWHDIYNKITGLRGYVGLIREHITDHKAEEFLAREEEILKVIQQQIAYTKEYQKMGQNPLCWQNLKILLNNIRNTGVAGLIPVVNEAENLELFADPALDRVFWHLIDNSVKYGKHVTEIRITARESEYGLTLVYQDNGVGIAANLKKDLFTKGFGKVTGFNLFFVHDMLEISGMKINETGEPGNGVRFEIRIPKGQYRFVRS